MNALRRLERAFLAAHEAGDKENAQLLADELRRLTTPPVVEEPAPQPKTGFMPNVKAGIQSLLGDIEAIKAGAGVEGAAEAAAERSKKASELGAVPEFTEKPLEYVTSLAGRSVPYMAAPLAAGLAVSPYGRLASMLGAGAVSTGQFSGSHLSRQLDVGTAAGDLDVKSAVAAAVPAAALDVLGFKFIPGIRRIFGAAGVPIGNKEAASIVGKYVAPALTAAGVEGATEAGQAVLERLQAGLNITNEEARKEYFQNFMGGAILGGALSIPGSALEGMGAPAPAAPVSPTQTPDEQEAPQEAAAETQAVEGAAEPGRRFSVLEKPVMPSSAVAAPSIEAGEAQATEAAPQDVFKLMEHHDTLKNSLDPLAERIQQAQAAGDAATAKSLTAEYRDNAAALAALETKIGELGGVTQSREEIESAYTGDVKKIDAAIAKLQNTVAEMRRADIRDYDAADKAELQIEKLQAKREAMESDFLRKRNLLRVKETPVDETIPLFDAEAAVPQPTEVLKFETRDEKGNVTNTFTEKDIELQENAAKQPKPEVDEKAVAAKQAEADKLLEELVALSPKYNEKGELVGGVSPAAEASRAAAVAELNDARARLRQVQEASAKSPSTEMDEAVTNAQTKVAQLSSQLESLSPRSRKEQFITDVNAKSEKLNQLYADIDALQGGVKRVAAPPPLFGKRNVLYTRAANTGKPEDMLKLLQYEQELGKKDKSEDTSKERERLVAVLQNRLDLPGKEVKRTVNEEQFQRVMDEIARIQNTITGKLGNAKQSVYEKAESLYKKLNELKAVIDDDTATAVQKGYARRSYNKEIVKYEALLADMEAKRDQVYALTRSLYETKEVQSASDIAAEKQRATEALGRSQRELSRPVKRAAKVDAKGAKVDANRVARELGEKTDEYQKFAKSIQKKIDTRQTTYNNFTTKGEAVLAKMREEGGDTSERYKTTQANFVKESKARQQVLNKFKDEQNAVLDAKAVELGKAVPEYKDALKKAQEKYTKQVTAQPQEAASLRSPQATRRVAKLGVMTTASPESRAASARRQAAFEGNLNEEKGDIFDYGQKQEREARIAEMKERAARRAKPTNAMQTAFQKAARDMAEGVEAEKAREARGSEIESADLTPRQVSMLEKNNVSGAFESIVDDKKALPLNRAVAAALQVMLDKTNVKLHDKLVDQSGSELLGQATSAQIDISRNGGLTQEVLLHEGTHSAVERVIQMAKQDITQLSKEQQAAYRELQALFASVKRDPAITSENAKTDISEFAAEVMSNENLQNQLRQKKWRVSDAFRGFVSIILKMIGVRNVDNMLDASVSAVEALMVPSSAGKAGVAEETRAKPKEIGVVENKDGSTGFKSHTEKVPAASSFVAKDQRMVDGLKANFLGLSGRVQLVDKYAAISEAFKKGLSEGQISSLEAGNAEYFLRFGENRSQYAQQILTNGPLKKIANEVEGGKEFVYKSQAGANLLRVFEKLSGAGIKNSSELDRMFTGYVAGKRAQQVGWEKLWVGNPAKAKAEYNEIMAQVNSDPAIKQAFEAAAKEYRDYNNGLMDLLVQTGAMTKEEASRLKAIDYVPYYRLNKGSGDVELFTDKERPIRIGNIKDEPQLQELVGDNTEILPLSVSAVQNAFMLVDMALRNQTMQDTAFVLHKMGIVSKIGEGRGPANASTVRFRVRGVPHFAVIDQDMYGIPAQLIVRGMEGIKTTLPLAVQMMGVPADILRKFITRNPAYAIRQAIRDPLTAWMTTGVDGVPVLNSMRELASMVAGRSDVERTLMEAGAISSNVFTGDQRDRQRFLRDISVGKSGWEKWMAKADAFALQGDAATRAVIYRDSIAKGLSEQQALLRTLESMNFGRRGLAPSLQMLNTLIPFFNAQIQGLDVLYRAFKGQMPYSEQMRIRQKLVARGLLLSAGTLAYAAAMQDDEAYRRAKPEERLGNWFVHIPGIKDPLKVPIPFELGYLFKALPEAVFNMAAEDERSSDITKGMGKLVGMSNPLALPAAIKPLTEAVLGTSFFGGSIESAREKATLMAGERYRSGTTELAKLIGSATGEVGLSPIMLEHLVRGYTGGLGIALISLANPLLETSGVDVEKPSKRAYQLPFIGGLFQNADGRGLIDASYDRMLEIQQAKGTFDRLRQQGKTEEAAEFLEKYRNRVAAASLSGAVQQQMGEIAAMRRQVIESPRLTQEEKDARLEIIEQRMAERATRFLEATR